MRANEFTYSNCPISFEPVQEQYYPPEEFRYITDDIVPGIRPYYMISNYGRIWHIYRREFLTRNIDSKGYLFKPLTTDHGTVNCRIHRLVLMTFNYIQGCERLFVNHIDGVKTNCVLWNLEWVTASENMIHAVNTGLLNPTDNRTSEDTVRKICELLEDPSITISTIAEQTGVNYQTVSAIQQKRVYCDISDQYNIQPRKINNNLSIDQVRQLCRFYENHNKYAKLDIYCRDALIAIGIPNPSTREIRTAKKIYQKETYTYVSQDYNF